jgi:hypothetical protein
VALVSSGLKGAHIRFVLAEASIIASTIPPSTNVARAQGLEGVMSFARR